MSVLLAPGDRDSASVDFFLNRGLKVGDIEVDGSRADVVMESDIEQFPFAPAARRVIVPAPGPAGPGAPRRVRLEIPYEGSLHSGPGGRAPITAGLTELNFYAAWFPLFEGPQGFGYDVEIDVPAGYEVMNGGSELPAAPSEGSPARRIRRFVGRSSAGDIAILVASGYTRIAAEAGGDCDLDFFSTGLPAGMQRQVASEAAWACGFLAGRSGWDVEPPGGSGVGERPRLLLVVVPREDPGYARPPLVVAPAGWFVEAGGAPETEEEEAGWRRRLFHEIAHNFAPLSDTLTYHDWINEGLADHLALQAVAARRGDEAAARYYRRYTLEIAERPPAPPVNPGESVASSPLSMLLPAISVTNRRDPDAALLYYRKGALIFRMIEGLTGEERFSRVIAGLRRSFPATGAARMRSSDLIEALEKTGEGPFDWLQADWIDGTSLPRIDDAPGLEWVRLPDGAGWRVSGRLTQAPGRQFSLRLPLLARRGPREERMIAVFRGSEARVEWTLPFKPDVVLVDPERIVPRFDETVDLALLLRAAIRRMRGLAGEGIQAERSRDPGLALARYEEAASAVPSSAYPWYRKGHALIVLGMPEPAEEAYRLALNLGEREAAARERTSRTCAAGPAMACTEPAAWVDAPVDLRSWSFIRIGEIHDTAGQRAAAVRAYESALASPDRLGAHEKARACLHNPCLEPPAGEPGGD